jgi:hypothetical protein
MEKLKLVAHAVTEDLNCEESMIIEIFRKGTDWLFKVILVLGIPFFLFVIGQFLGL